MMRPPFHPHLAPLQRKWRIAWLALLPGALGALAFVEPGSLPAWFPFATSCGAITGLPCIFCGLTRGLHYFLHGQFGRALYYNWLVFPLLVGALAFSLTNGLELFLDRNLLSHLPRLRLTRTSVGGLFAVLVVLWCLQVYLAVSQHKAELLNPRGPLYSLVVH